MCVLCGLEKMSLKGQGKRREVKLRWCLKRVGKYDVSEAVSGLISVVTIKCSVLFAEPTLGAGSFTCMGFGNREDKRESKIKIMVHVDKKKNDW